MFTAIFWRRAAERAVKTFAQAAGAMLAASGVGLLDAAWAETGSVAGMAALLSVLTSVASGAVGNPEDPSVTP